MDHQVDPKSRAGWVVSGIHLESRLVNLLRTCDGSGFACLEILLSNLSSFQFPTSVSLPYEVSLFVHLQPNWLNFTESVECVHTSASPLARTIAWNGGLLSKNDIFIKPNTFTLQKMCMFVDSFDKENVSWQLASSVAVAIVTWSACDVFK